MSGVDLKALEAAGFRSSDAKGGSGAGPDDEKRQAMEEGRRMMLKNFLTPEARERLSRVALVKPDNARAVEEHIIRLGRSGKLSAQVTEDGLIRMLEEVMKAESEARGVSKKIVITRRRRDEDEDDDDDDF